jgi:hypothetical protein
VTGESYPMLAGNLGSFCGGAIITIVVTLIKPDNDFDWSKTQKINPRGRELANHPADESAGTSTAASTSHESDIGSTEKRPEKGGNATSDAVPVREDLIAAGHHGEDFGTLEKSFKVAVWASLILSFIIVFVSISLAFL